MNNWEKRRIEESIEYLEKRIKEDEDKIKWHSDSYSRKTAKILEYRTMLDQAETEVTCDE